MKRIYLNISYGSKDIKRAKGYVLDIGKYGMGIASTRAIRRNMLIEVKTDNNILSPMRCKVVSGSRRNKKPYAYRTGLKFLSLENKSQQKLERLLKRLEKRRAIRLVLVDIWKPDHRRART